MKEVHWINLNTGVSGHGEPIDDNSADAWIPRLERMYPYIYHWTVRVFEARA
jgi:hypothetical protein